MGVFGIGTETYLYVNGLLVNEEIELGKNKTLMPTQCKLPIDTLSRLVTNDTDFAIIILCAGSIASQLRIIAEDPKDLSLSAWNSQWDLILLSSIFGCDAICNLLCTHPIDAITEESKIQITNYHLRGLLRNTYTVTQKDVEWINKYFINAQSLLDKEAFTTAVHSMATYKWHTLPRVQLAILWAGIESLFGINTELSFRISLYASKFLADGNKDTVKEIFSETKDLYKARSAAVHGDNIKGDPKSLVAKSASLLNRLIIKCIMVNGLPKVEDLIY